MVDTSVLDSNVENIVIDSAIPGLNVEIPKIEGDISTEESNEDYLRNNFAISLDAMKKGVKLQEERFEEGKEKYYESVFTEFIQPNKMLMDQINQQAIAITQKKFGENATPGYADQEAIKEASRMMIDRMYDMGDTNIKNSFANYQNEIYESTSGKEAMLLGGIDDTYAMNRS